MKILFVTDIHGSSLIFRKALSLSRELGIDLLILSGDLSGKEVIPTIEENGNLYLVVEGKKSSKRELIKDFNRFFCDSEDFGRYIIKLSSEEYQDCLKNHLKAEDFYLKAVIERIKSWVIAYKQTNTNFKILICPGNDDQTGIDVILNNLRDNQVLIGIDEVCEFQDFKILNYSIVPTTPWRTPREKDDKLIREEIKSLIKRTDFNNNLIFNIHTPPFNTLIDYAPYVDDQLKLVIKGGSVERIHVGSEAVYEIIAEYQPILSLHGHIHESSGELYIGKTLCVNPGSEYGQGILRGYFFDLVKDKIVRFHRVER